MIQFSNKPPKKLVVKNLKNKPKVSDEYEAAALARISSTIDSVFKDEELPYGHEEIYRNCETLCKFHVAGQVYKILYEKCEREAKASSANLIKECEELMNEVEYLKRIEKAWESFQRHYCLLESLFLYLDKVYINQQTSHTYNSSTTSSHFVHIKRFGLNFFRSYYLMNSSLLGKEMVQKLMLLIERIRTEKISDGEIFELGKKLIEMIRELEEYSQGELEFEKLLIERTWTFYEQESLEETSKKSLADYLQYASERLTYESEVICSVLAPITRDKLMKCVKERVILDQMKSFMFPKPTGSSLRKLFDSGDRNSIKLMYEMINSVFEVEVLATEWTAFMRSHGQELMAKGNDYRTIERVAIFKEQVDEIIKECFDSDPILQGTLKDAFETIMNGRRDRSAELLALYVHQKLQSDTINSDPSEYETILSIALLLFRYLHRKEAFDSFYKRTLAQRLLFHGSNLSLERQFISKLREECGGGFVSRMESMLKDVEQSSEMTQTFKKSDSTGMSKGLASVTGITVVSGLWPSTSSNRDGIKAVPSSMEKIEKDFNQFYTSQKKNCSLNWQEMMGNVVMRSNFPAGRFNLNLTIPQALVLLQFNENDTCSFDKLLQGVKFERKLLEETLKSLSDPLYPILVRSDINVYKFNEQFEYKGTGKVPLYALQSPFLPVEEEIIGLLGEEGDSKVPEQQHQRQQEQQSNVSAIADRQGQVDSLLVRRMKQQSRSNRKDLVNYVLANLGNVRVSAGDVDGRIDELIAKVFLQLDEEDNNTVIYVP